MDDKGFKWMLECRGNFNGKQPIVRVILVKKFHKRHMSEHTPSKQLFAAWNFLVRKCKG